MFGSTILDVAIGMIFVYLLLSLLCSAVNEYVEAKMNYRGKNLWRGIQLLLNGVIKEEEAKNRLTLKDKSDGKTKSDSAPGDGAGDAGQGKSLGLAADLYNHGLIRALFQDVDRLPSYIPSHTFALALWNLATKTIKNDPDFQKIIDPNKTPTLQEIEALINKAPLNEHLKESLIALIDQADGNFERAVKNIEDWYDSAMDRVSGWYKRRVQWILIVIGFVVAAFINADSVNIARALIQDKTLRDVIVASATEYAKENGGASSSASSAETKKGGADANSNASNSNASGAGGGNSNARRERATKTGGANDNSANANSNNTNTAAGGGGNANTHQSNSNDAGTTEAAGGTPAPTPAPSPNPIQQAYEKVNALGLPIGWNLGSSITKDPVRGIPHQGDGESNALSWLLMKLFGILLTGLAISQGAPFWFDLLNKFMVIRSTVKPKEKSPDEASKDKTTPNPKRDTHGTEDNNKT